MDIKCITYYIIIGFCSFSHVSFGQDQRAADSLKQIYHEVDLDDSARLIVLRALVFNETKDLNLALSYVEDLIQLAKDMKSPDYQAIGHYQKGNTLKVLGNLDEALNAYLKSISIAKESGFEKIEGSTYGAIADIFSITNDHSNAMLYYNKGISVLRQTKDSISLASAILNAGDEYLTYGDYDSALLYFSESGKIFEQVNYKIGQAYNLGNIGMVYASTGENILAEKNINQAIEILEKAEDYYPICFYLLSMSDVFMDRKDVTSAINYAGKSLRLAVQYQLKQQISEANLKLSELYEMTGESSKAFAYYRNHITYRDSVNNIETVQKIANQRTDFEVNLREKEIALLEKGQTLDRTYIVIAVTLLVLAVVLLLYFRQRFLTTQLAAAERRKRNEQKIKDLLYTQESKALQSMVKGQDDERKRLAKDLHNHFGNLLATIKVNINVLEHESIPNYPTLTTLIDQACTDVRNIAHELNMGISDDFGLVPALKELTEHLKKSGHIQIEFSASMCNHPMETDEEITIYRIVQELVSNTLKHAQASKLSISLTCFEEDHLINIIVQDNGHGIEGAVKHADSSGMGINTLKKMIENLHGEMIVDSSAKKGTTVNIDLPLKPTTEAL
ncbi:ATP-binding protein [Reichenbachiella sp.]|uniref:tetratricopeptide repeat-containing sensor histidine kinase n=1 Tax=Reichenbachiella sp. TaxID=2184521 RepID=UPI003299504B